MMILNDALPLWNPKLMNLPVKIKTFVPSCSTAHRGLQEEVVYHGRQKTHVLQRPSGKRRPSPLVASLSTLLQRVCSPDCQCSLSPRMPMPAARSSSAARRTATPCCRACPHPRRATTGTTASPSSRRIGSSCLPAKPKLSNAIG